MKYRLFLYGTTAVFGKDWVLNRINDAVNKDSEEQWENFYTDDLRPFDTEAVVSRIENALKDPVSGKCKCRLMVKYPPSSQHRIGYIYIATSYREAAEVLPLLHAVALEYDLALYDAETGRTFYHDLVDRVFITMRLRQQELHQAILKQINPFRGIRCVEEYCERGEYHRSYVVTIRKERKVSFAERTLSFYQFLKEHLRGNEKLVCDDQSFKICGEGYIFTYVLEGYRKDADRIGFMKDDEPRAELIRRMSVDKAFRWMKEHCNDAGKKTIFARMRFKEMVCAYPNPARRFVESVNITKWQFRQVFDICYGGLGPYGSEILFHIVPDEYYDDNDNISVLKIEESSATFILPFINDIYPYIYERYYLEPNHIPWEMMWRIIEHLKEAKEMILHRTFDPELRSCIENFNIFIFKDMEDPLFRENFWKIDKVQTTYEHRYEIAEFYDVFIHWVEAQLEAYKYRDDLMFNIQGP